MLIELRVDRASGSSTTSRSSPAVGLTAITGETGAGKTLLVEALELLLGARADAGLVRDGAAEARVEGRFVDPESGDEVVLARVVPVDGRSRAYVDGRLATVGRARRRTARDWSTCTGSTRTRPCSTPAVQRSALDRFAGAPALDAAGALPRGRASPNATSQAELDALGGDDRARARELDLLRFQIYEIDAAAIADDAEDVTLEAEETLLADVGRPPRGPRHRVRRPARARRWMPSAARAPRSANRRPFADLVARLRAVQAELGDLGSALRHERDSLSDDPAPLDAVRTRRQLLRELTPQVRRDPRRGPALRRRGGPAPGGARGLRGPGRRAPGRHRRPGPGAGRRRPGPVARPARRRRRAGGCGHPAPT